MLDATVPAQEAQTSEVEGKIRDVINIAWIQDKVSLEATGTQLAPGYLEPGLDNRSSTYILFQIIG